MSPLTLRPTANRIPGRAQVSEHSLFAAVSAAEGAPVVVVPRSSSLGEPPRASLSGFWRRLPLPVDPESVGALPGPEDPAWQPVLVPNCYGAEPSLSAHFGPVFYQRKLIPLPAESTRLVFDAVDYLCDVWVDGQHLGRHEGYFAPFAFDVTDHVRPGSVLTVRVQDPFEELDPDALFFQHAKRVIKGTLKYHDSRPGGLPGRTTPGWTARVGQSMTSAGITREARLEGTGAVRLDAVFVTPLDVARGAVHVAVVLTNVRNEPVDVVVDLELGQGPGAGGGGAGAVALRAPPGASRFDVELTVPCPKAWWPGSHRDLGGPVLYDLAVRAVVGALVSDVRSTRFGLRTARVTGEPKHLELNGRSVFAQAVNYIPKQHFADATKEFYLRDLAICADAHVNSLGVHGHLQCRPCYDAADEAGMLVFQDFPLQWHYDSGTATNPAFIDLACRQIADMAYTFYNHPSIVYWACHNEPTTLFVPGAPKDAARDFDNQVLDERLEERLREVEQHRHVHRASGIGDDFHLYDGSLNGGAVYGVRDAKSWFVSEYGYWTVGPEAHRFGDLEWPPDATQMKEWLSRLSFAPWTFQYSGLPERYGSLDAWRRATEAYGEFLAKYQTEWIRMHRGNPFNAYRWHFFADWWCWAGGGLVDVDRKPKATYHAFRAASRPILVLTSLPNTVFRPGAALEFEVFAVNETRTPVELDVGWSFHRSEQSLVIGADLEASDRYNVFTRATPNTMVAMPVDAPGVRPLAPGAGLDAGRLRGTVGPESVATLGVVKVALPREALVAGRLELAWGTERNYFYALAAEEGWFPGPGAFIVGPGGVSRLT
jgi:beta-mannosidase